MPADAITLFCAYGRCRVSLLHLIFLSHYLRRVPLALDIHLNGAGGVAAACYLTEWAVLQRENLLTSTDTACSSTEFTLSLWAASCGRECWVSARCLSLQLLGAITVVESVKWALPLSYQITRRWVRTRRLTFGWTGLTSLKASLLAAQAGTALTFFVHPRFKHDLL